MKISRLYLVFAFLFALPSMGQISTQGPSAGGMVVRSDSGPGKMLVRHEMGKWWQDSDVAKKLQLSDSQLAQLDQIFYDHRMKLIDYQAEMEKEDLKLQSLLDADVPNEGQVGTEVDQVLAARGKLEREFTTMNLDLRKVLSVEQWRQLKTIRGERSTDHVFFYKKLQPGSSLPANMPPPPPPGGPAPDDPF
jgi:Spy/CpxP family protein refolding chaperone